MEARSNIEKMGEPMWSSGIKRHRRHTRVNNHAAYGHLLDKTLCEQIRMKNKDYNLKEKGRRGEKLVTRWADFANTSPCVQFVANKTKAALDGGLGVILCIGETLEVCYKVVPFLGPGRTEQVARF